MAKTGVTYEQVAYTCQTLLKEGQTITARGILGRTGGSPNGVVKHWQRWRQEQEGIALAAVDEELSPQIKQAILAECARKTALVKQQWTDKVSASEQQLAEIQTLLHQAELDKEKLLSELSQIQVLKTEQDKRQAVADQRLRDAESRNKELEQLYRETSLAQERAKTEKSMIEQQKELLEKRLNNLENELKACQTSKHQCDLEIAKLIAKK
jgi:plasmid replication DNA-binding protein KfrA